MKKFVRRNRSLFNALLIVSMLTGLFPSVALSAPPVLSPPASLGMNSVEGPPSAIEPTGPEGVAVPYVEPVANPSPRSQIEDGEVAAQPLALSVTDLAADTSTSTGWALYNNGSASPGHLPALAIPSEQSQPVTNTWDFESGQQGWLPSNYGGTGMSWWELYPSVGGSVGVWRAPRYGQDIYIYIYYPHLVSLDQVSVDFYIRESGFNVGGARLTVYTSTNMINWVTVGSYGYEPSGGGHYSWKINAEVSNKYVMVRLNLWRAFVPTVYGYIDNVTFRNCIGCDVHPLPPDQTWAPNECPFCNTSQAQNRVGGPINTYSGNYNYQQTDLSVAALGQPLRFERSYNSGAAELYTTTLGYGWTHNYDISLAFPDDPGGEPDTVILKSPHGSRLRFTDNGDGTYTAAPGVWATMTREGSDPYTYTITATA